MQTGHACDCSDSIWSHDQHLVGSTAEPSIIHGAAMPEVPRELALRGLHLAFPLHLDIVPRDDGLHLLGSHLSRSLFSPSPTCWLRVGGTKGEPSVIIKNLLLRPFLLLVFFPPSTFLSEVETGTEPSRQHTSGLAHQSHGVKRWLIQPPGCAYIRGL